MRRALAALLLTALPASAQDDAAAGRAVERQVRRVIDGAEAGVVAVVVSHSPRHPTPDDKQPWKLGPVAPDFGRGIAPGPPDPGDPAAAADFPSGSGVVLDRTGLVLTSYHLIDGARKIFVRSAAGAGSYADIHAADARADLAVLKLINPVAGLKPVRLADARLTAGPGGEPPTLARGTMVVSLGHPHAAGAADGVPSASWGVVSAVRRRGPPPNTGSADDQRSKPLHQYGQLIQTDARITLGCSGAALLDLDGQLVGLAAPTAAFTGADTAGGYAIPMDPNTRRIVEVLKAGREVEYGLLGVTFDPAPAGRRSADGLVITGVTPNGPADAAGLVGRPGGVGADQITAVDGNRVREYDDLFLHVGAALAGNPVTLDIVRDGERKRVRVVLAKYAHRMESVASVKPPAVHGLRVDWASTALESGGRDIPAGVLVREAEPGTPAGRAFDPQAVAGKRLTVTRVNGRPVATPAEFARGAAAADPIRLTVVESGGTAATREVTLP